MASTVPDINVFAGKDPTVRNATDGSISGLEQLPATTREGLFSMVRDEARVVFEGAPQELVDATLTSPMPIPIYGGVGAGYSASVHLRDANSLQLRGTGPHDAQPVGYRLPKFSGLRFGIQPDRPLAEMRAEAGHELIHVLTRFGIHTHMRSPLEALTARIEKLYYGDERAANGLQGSHPWNPDRYSSTTGLRPPDFAETGLCFGAVESLYLSSYTDADALSAEQAWNIWTVLNAQGAQIGMMPKFQDIERALLEHGQENGQRVLQKASFQPMQEGLQHFAFGTGTNAVPGDFARVYSFQVGKHADFGNIDPQTGVRRERIFETRNLAGARYQHLFYDKKNRPIQEIKAEGMLEHQHDFTFDGMMTRVSSSREAMTVLNSKMGNRMGIAIQGLPVIVLQKESDAISTGSSPVTPSAAPRPSTLPRSHDDRTKAAKNAAQKRKKEERQRKKRNR